MTTLREAAQQALDVMSDISSFERWSEAKEALRAALAEPPTNQCGETCERAKLCAVCARELEGPVQEPVAVRWRHPQYRWTYEDYKPGQFYGPRVEVQRLYTAPPQRKPLAEWQINDLMADIDPEDVCSWSFRQGVYAAEKHHGVRS